MADVFFYAVMLLRIFPCLLKILPGDVWYAVLLIMILRISSYLTSIIKYRKFPSLHTYLNKVTGLAVFCIPFLLHTECLVLYCRLCCVLAVLAALEELVIHLYGSANQVNLDM